MNIEHLKALNKPENLIEQYQIQLPMYAIPTETLEQLLTMLSAIGQGQAPIQENIAKLPTWQDIQETLYPILEQNGNSYLQAALESEKSLERVMRNQSEALKSMVMKTISEQLKDMERSLMARDLTPLKIRLKWMGWGALVPTILFALLWILKTL